MITEEEVVARAIAAADRDAPFIRLFRWAVNEYQDTVGSDVSVSRVVGMLSVEGVRQFFPQGVPTEHREALRKFRKLTQKERERKVTRLFP